MFFHTLRDAWKFLSRKYSTFSQQIATATLQIQISQINKAFQASMLLPVGTCALVFLYNMRYDWKKYNQSQLGKEKSTLLRFICR